MARAFSSRDARGIQSRMESLRRDLADSDRIRAQQRAAVQEAAEKYAIEEALEILRSVPVEEVNQQKEGFRTQLLRESGYETMADLWRASLYELIALDGIGELMAGRIRERTRSIADAAIASVKIRLSADSRDPRSTELVRALDVCMKSDTLLRICAQMRSWESERIDRALNDLGPALNGLSWLLTLGRKREKTEAAFQTLTQLLEGEYGRTARRAFQGLEEAEATPPETAWEEFARDPIPFIRLLEEIAPERMGGGELVYGLPETLAEAIRDEEMPLDGLRCSLRRYQVWGVKYILHQQRVLLGDEMGLGKTVQAIAAMVALRNSGATHFLVVCPAGVLSNWCREIQRHSDLHLIRVYGPQREAAFRAWQSAGGVAVTSYESTGRLTLGPGLLFDMITVDEAHYIKNPEAQRSRNVRRLCTHARRVLFMTGTALENRVEEMLQLLSILHPEIAREAGGIAFMASAPQFRERVAPVYFRRRREEVLTELPELIESREWCRLGQKEAEIYELDVLGKNAAQARRVSWSVGDLKESCKAKRMLELIEDAAEDGRKILVFTFFLETARLICQLLGERCLGPINGSVPPGKRQEIIDRFHEAPAGTVLVSQIQSGGTGLNIQAASVVILCEPQFKPSTENQAISRAYRMGQGRSVLVYRLLCENTVDERILDLLEEKQAVFDAFADRSEAAGMSLELDEMSFGQILEEERKHILDRRGERKTED